MYTYCQAHSKSGKSEKPPDRLQTLSRHRYLTMPQMEGSVLSLAHPSTHVRIHTRAATKSRIPFCDKTVKRLSWADTDSPRQLNPTPSLEPRRRVAKL
jgi:hypothetical protein